MKLLIATLTFIFISLGVKAHSLNGVYECKTSSWSPFKTKVEIKNFKNHSYSLPPLGALQIILISNSLLSGR